MKIGRRRQETEEDGKESYEAVKKLRAAPPSPLTKGKHNIHQMIKNRLLDVQPLRKREREEERGNSIHFQNLIIPLTFQYYGYVISIVACTKVIGSTSYSPLQFLWLLHLSTWFLAHLRLGLSSVSACWQLLDLLLPVIVPRLTVRNLILLLPMTRFFIPSRLFWGIVTLTLGRGVARRLQVTP